MDRKISNSVQAKMDQCRICGDVAIYSYFGTLACRPCKMFFKRNAENKQKVFRCDFGNRCEINVRTRHVCAACRLKKCFDCGMQVDKIRRSASSNDKTTKAPTESVPHTDETMALLPTINLLRADISSLTTNQWTLLNNLIHQYNTSNLFLLADQINEQRNERAVNTTLVRDFVSTFYENAGESIRSNQDINQLLFNDRAMLLPTSISNITCLTATYIFSQANLHAHSTFINYMRNLYTYPTVDYHRRCSLLAVADYVLFKLILALFTLSSNARTCYQNFSDPFEDVKQLVNLEDQYAEVTWKYLLYRYSFRDAVHRYDELIRWVLSVTALADCGEEPVTHLKKVQTIVEEIEFKLVLDDVENMVETTEANSYAESLVLPISK